MLPKGKTKQRAADDDLDKTLYNPSNKSVLGRTRDKK